MKSSGAIKLLILSLSLLAMVLAGGSPNSAEAKTYKWKLATEVPPDWELNTFINEFCANVEKRTDGNVKIAHYNAGQLGGHEELYTVMKQGGIAMVLGPPDPGYDPRLNFLFMPYVVTNMDQVEKLYSPDGFAWKTMDEILSEQGVKVVTMLDLGFFEVVNNKRPVRKPEDGQGIKIRVMRYKGQEVFYSALGFAPIPMDMGESITALQTGVIDGEGCNGSFLHALYLKGLFKFNTPLHAFYESAAMLVNKQMFTKLPEAYQKIITEEGVKLMKRQRQWLLDNAEGLLQMMEKDGVKVERLTPEELNVFIKIGRDTWPQMEELIGKDLMDRLIKAVQ